MLIIDSHRLNAAVLPGLSVQPCEPLQTPRSLGRHRLCVLRARSRHSLSRHSETDAALGPFYLYGHQNCLLFVFPALFPVPGRASQVWVPSGLERRRRRSQRSKGRRQQPPAVSLAFFWAATVMGCPGASPAPCADGHGRTLPPLCFTSSLCLSEPPCEAMATQGRDWMLHGFRAIEI